MLRPHSLAGERSGREPVSGGFVLLFWASLAALVVGPALLAVFGHRRVVVAFLDGYVLVAVGGLILLDVLPHAFEHVGAWAVLAAVVGLALPLLVERALGKLGRMAHRGTVILALAGLAVHSLMDGMALRGHGDDHDESIALGVVLHRLPLGLLIWGVIRPWAGRLGALGLLGLEASGTAVGFLTGMGFDGPGLGLFEGLVAGALLHVVLYNPLHGHEPQTHEKTEETDESDHHHGVKDTVHEPTHTRTSERQVGVVGVFLGAATLLALGHDHLASTSDFGRLFGALALLCAPLLLLAFVVAGLLRAFAGTPTLAWLSLGGPLTSALRGLVFGLPRPVVACGVLPLYEGLVRAGAPAGAALAFLVVTPELALDTLLLSWPLLGPELTAVRIGAAVVLALGVALTLGAGLGRQPGTPTPTSPRATVGQRLRLGLRFGLGELVDHTLPWVAVGLALAAATAPLIAGTGFATLHPAQQIVIGALLGAPFYVSATGATPMAALLILQGASPGAAVAFLLTGPGLSATALRVLARLHGRRAAVGYALATLILAVTLGGIVHGLAPAAPPPPVEFTPANVGLPRLLALAALGALLLASLVRLGPRGVTRQITDPVDAD